MKDLYSAHATEKDLMSYYEKVKGAYSKIFDRLGFKFKITEASGGVFTENRTHEFQVMTPGGEDTIYYCDKCDWGINKEIFGSDRGNPCQKCKKGKMIEAKSIEVGNIFPFGTWYSERMKAYYADKDGKKKLIHFGSYGIGSTRVMGALVEVSHDEKGIIWYPQAAPFEVHLIELNAESLKLKAEKIYDDLGKAGIEVLWDDREVSAGEKFADADLIGIPVRLVVSRETGDKVEWKERTAEKVELLSLVEIIQRLKNQ